jgi:hypothetical protein
LDLCRKIGYARVGRKAALAMKKREFVDRQIRIPVFLLLVGGGKRNCHVVWGNKVPIVVAS